MTDCRKLIAELAKGGALSAEAEAHRKTCASCQQLTALSAPGPRVPKGLVGELTPVRPGLSTGAVLTLFAALLGGITLAGSLGMGTKGMPFLSFAQVMVLGAVGVTAAAGLALATVQGIRPGARVWVNPAVSAWVPLLAFLAVCGFIFPWHYVPGTFVAHGMGCLQHGLTVAVASAFGTAWLGWRGYVQNWVVTAGTLGSFSGLIGATVLHVACPDQEAAHLLVWHGGIWAGSTLGGLMAGYLLSRRSQ